MRLLRWLVSVATQAEIVGYRRALDSITLLAVADIDALLGSLDLSRPVAVRDALIEAFPDVIGPYVNATGELTASWYEDLRERALPGTYYAVAASGVNPGKVDGLVRWSVGPLFEDSESGVLSRLGGGVQRMIAGAGRDTIDMNARQDSASVSWARVARPDSCEFCKMLAGRGAVYRSEATAGMVVGRGVDPSATVGRGGGQGRGVRGRGSRPVGASSFHDRCRCTAQPTFYEVGSFVNPRTGREESALVPIGDPPPLELAA